MEDDIEKEGNYDIEDHDIEEDDGKTDNIAEDEMEEDIGGNGKEDADDAIEDNDMKGGKIIILIIIILRIMMLRRRTEVSFLQSIYISEKNISICKFIGQISLSNY